ncbi:MAG: hypothetical protein KDB53_13585 [Planctomycetes bacterium]|nr:hypothetical protein [Planctomycetota bacterium]
MSEPKSSIVDLTSALAWLAAFTDYEQKNADQLRAVTFELGRMQALCEGLGHPERRAGYVHVAGSKGKGSTVFFTEALLRAAGNRTGRFLSPHLETVTERIAIDGRSVTGAEFAALTRALGPYVEACRHSSPDRLPSFFECLTAMAFLAFADPAIDYCVLEVGLGGRLDATNVVKPDVTLITSIDLEHTRVLGSTRTAIAREKAGIIKPGIPVVVGFSRDSEEGQAVDAIVCERGAPAWWLGEEVRVESVRFEPDGTHFDLFVDDLEFKDLVIAAAGPRQPDNAALAVAALHHLGRRRLLPWNDDVMRHALATLQLPARLELIPPHGARRATIILDCAHTPASMAALAGMLGRQDLPCLPDLLLGMLRDKDVDACLAPLASRMNRVYVTAPDSPRALDPSNLRTAVERIMKPAAGIALIEASEMSAFLDQRLASEHPLVVAGSVYLAGTVRRHLRNRRGSVDDPWTP